MPAAICYRAAHESCRNSSGRIRLVVNATLAISDFMLMLLTSALWLGSGVIGIVLLGLATCGGLCIAARHWWRSR